MSAGDEIFQVSLNAMRQLTLEQLLHERENIEKHVKAAVEMAEMVLDICIDEKRKKLSIN